MFDTRNRFKKTFYSLLCLIGYGASLGAPLQSASAAIPPEQACQEALRLNTIDALEDYLRLYPNANTACNALALDALNQFGQRDNEGNNRDGATGGTDGGYGG